MIDKACGPQFPTDRFRSAILMAVLVLLPTLQGCTARSLRDAQEAYREVNIAEAERSIREFVMKDGEGVDRIIAYLELGNILRAQGDFEASNEAFRIVDEAIREIDEGAGLLLSKEAMALLTNMNALPYRGQDCDRVMLSTYKAVNFLVLGEPEDARVEFRRAHDRQTEAVERNAKRIEKMEEEIAAAKRDEDEDGGGSGKKGYDVSRALDDEQFKTRREEAYGDPSRYDAYADYVNPMAVLLHGLYFTIGALDGDDSERGRFSLDRLAKMVPTNPYVAQDLALAEQVVRGADVVPITYVILENGTAPKRGPIRIDIPLFLVTGAIDYVGVNFPRLIMNDDCLQDIEASVGGKSYTTRLVADMDSVVAQEFHNDLPVIIFRTLLSAGAKAMAAKAVRDSFEKNSGGAGGTDWASLAARVAAASYQVGVNQADLRTWATLPKQFQYARFPTPSDGKVHITGSNSLVAAVDVDVEPGTFNVVFVRSINRSAPLQVYNFTIKDNNTSWVADNSQ